MANKTDGPFFRDAKRHLKGAKPILPQFYDKTFTQLTSPPLKTMVLPMPLSPPHAPPLPPIAVIITTIDLYNIFHSRGVRIDRLPLWHFAVSYFTCGYIVRKEKKKKGGKRGKKKKNKKKKNGTI